jgi:hypothetical protein
MNRWPYNTSKSAYPRYTSNPGSEAYQAWNYHTTSDIAFTDASFIRLKNISFSYHLPERWTKKMKMSNVKLYLQGQNIITITKYTGNDPELPGSNFLPPLRIFTAGIQASL